MNSICSTRIFCDLETKHARRHCRLVAGDPMICRVNLPCREFEKVAALSVFSLHSCKPVSGLVAEILEPMQVAYLFPLARCRCEYPPTASPFNVRLI